FYVLSADYAAVATISIHKDTDTYPFANLFSISDGPIGNGTGIPYMYLIPLHYTSENLDVSKHRTLI
ncbi:Protein CREG1, partial [Camponotus floridanus]